MESSLRKGPLSTEWRGVLGSWREQSRARKEMGPQVSAAKALLLGHPGLVVPTDAGSHQRGCVGR